MTELLIQFVLALFATCGFCIIFNVPLKHIPGCVIIGAFGWVTYQVSMYYGGSPVLACFIASCLVGLMSDIFSRCFKEAATIFIIPGILCLVPGSGMFHTMTAMLTHDMSATYIQGLQTLLMAGAIAVGLLIMGAVIHVIRSFFN